LLLSRLRDCRTEEEGEYVLKVMVETSGFLH